MASSSSAHPRSRHLQADWIAMPLQGPNIPTELTDMHLPQPTQQKDRYSIAPAYEAKLHRMKNRALFAAGLQKSSRFFGICALTWATVALLGGFASSLKSLDFYLISILLVVEAARLSTTAVFQKLLSKTLFRERIDPEEFQHADLQYHRACRLDLIGEVCSCFVAIVGLILVTARLGITRQHSLSGGDESIHNLPQSLYAFYTLVILIFIPAIVSGFCRPFLRRSNEVYKKAMEVDLVCYFDEVYKKAMEVGMPEADDLDPFDFAFRKLASDHMRNIRPLTIKERNMDLIQYIYHSQNGVEVTCEYLRSNDVCKQQAAANLPGFWKDESKIEKQIALFWALRDRLYGAGRVAEGAANSLDCLARSWAHKAFERHPFLINDPSKLNSANIVDTLVEMVVFSVRPSLFFQIRALEGCCRNSQILQHIYSQGNEENKILSKKLQDMIVGNRGKQPVIQVEKLSRPEQLCGSLHSVLSQRSARERTKMYAANALKALLCFGGQLSEESRQSLATMVDKIDPARIDPDAVDKNGQCKRVEPYVLEPERLMLDKLREHLGLEEYKDWSLFFPDWRIRIPDPEIGNS